MRLWHQKIIDKLPRQQLLGQHRECAALRGKGWGKKHATVNYVFNHSYSALFYYHVLVMNEMKKRGYQPDEQWYIPAYRGKICEFEEPLGINKEFHSVNFTIYPEHNNKYLQECLDNLKNKGIIIEMEVSV